MPLVLIGLAGMINETFDRVLLKYLLPGTLEENLAQIGIYSAVYKISIFMTLAVQGFSEWSAEPFFFHQSSSDNAPKVYALVMKYFVIVCCIIFLGVGMFPDVFRIIIGENYHEGLGIVPVLLFANLLLGCITTRVCGIKLTDKTPGATIIPVAGAVLSIVANIISFPLPAMKEQHGPDCCAMPAWWLSHMIGQKYYHVPYNVRKILAYFAISIVLCLAGLWLHDGLGEGSTSFALRLGLIALFTGFAWWLDGGRCCGGPDQITCLP